MYVEYVVPAERKRPYPIVFMHGDQQTSTNWTMTPDGRPGWIDFFVKQGYAVYFVDQPERGRLTWHPKIDGPLRMFTAPEAFNLWLQAKLHTQRPGEGALKGRKGDPAFDAFYATQVESLAPEAETKERNRAAGAALLDRIGPAILVTHSQGGLIGWVIPRIDVVIPDPADEQ